jgi:hypothetical protein
MGHTRRAFIGHGCAAGGAGLLALAVAGRGSPLRSSGSGTSDRSLHSLTDDNVKTLDALGEALLPGSASEGLAYYIDHQLSVPLEQNLLMIRYLGVRPPFAEFYKTGLAGVEAAAKRQFGKGFTLLNAGDVHALVTRIAAGTIAEWSGPPPELFYFVLRSDAIDVVYGTMTGFGRLAVPYMAHIVPPSRWGE